jgi:hypothetical protein
MILAFPQCVTVSESYMPDVLLRAIQPGSKRQSVLLSGDDRSGEIAGLILGGVAHVRQLASVLPVDVEADRRIEQFRAAQQAPSIRRITKRK